MDYFKSGRKLANMAFHGGVEQLQQFVNSHGIMKQDRLIDSNTDIADIVNNFPDGTYHCLNFNHGAPNDTSGNGFLTKTTFGADCVIDFTDTVHNDKYWTTLTWGSFTGGWHKASFSLH